MLSLMTGAGLSMHPISVKGLNSATIGSVEGIHSKDCLLASFNAMELCLPSSAWYCWSIVSVNLLPVFGLPTLGILVNALWCHK